METIMSTKLQKTLTNTNAPQVQIQIKNTEPVTIDISDGMTSYKTDVISFTTVKYGSTVTLNSNSIRFIDINDSEYIIYIQSINPGYSADWDKPSGEFTITENMSVSVITKKNKFSLTLINGDHIKDIKILSVNEKSRRRKNDSSNEFFYGDEVKIDAIPEDGYKLLKWSDGVYYTPRLITIPANNQVITAIGKEAEVKLTIKNTPLAHVFINDIE